MSGRSFNPNDHKDDDTKPRASYLEQPGTYMLAFTSFKGRDSSARGSEFLKLVVSVVHGNNPRGQEGKIFTDRMFLTDAALKRLADFCRAMGHEDPWNPWSDSDVRRIMLNRPFKARVSTKTRDGKVYAEMAFPMRRNEVDGAEWAAADAWIAKQQSAVDDMAFDDSGDPQGSDESAPHSDDNIPF